MSANYQPPLYNMSAVLRKTGLKADVLRAWERRYHLPVPWRTPGGHRLYSEQDIETLQWLLVRMDEGLSISRAVELWKATRGSQNPAFAVPTEAAVPTATHGIDLLRGSWIKACLAFNEAKAEDALNQAFAMAPIEDVCRAVLQQGLNEIGQAWYNGEVSPQQEHFTSALAVRRIETLVAAVSQPAHPQTVLLGCPPGEWHSLPALLLNLYLRRRGWRVVFLGANLPVEQMEKTAAAIHPDLIILAAQQLTTVVSLQSAASLFQRAGFLLAYGGLIFNRVPAIRSRIPAHFLGETLEEGVRQAEELLLAPAPSPSGVSTEATQAALAGLYREKRTLIEQALLHTLRPGNLSSQQIEQANIFFGSGLSAALELGDPAYLEADLAWIARRSPGRNHPKVQLIPYLAAYGQAIRSVLGQAGAPIGDWISSVISNNEIHYATSIS